ncbi:MAG: HU family DNA-binding protein [Tannerella sp.]|nr:HU family DNA-binding protein [Tannerella sp.]
MQPNNEVHLPIFETFFMKDVELITTLSRQLDMPPTEATATLSALFELMGDVISNGGTVNISGLGQFDAKKKSERITVNPANGKRYLIPPKLTSVFKPASLWKIFLKKLDEQ